MAQPIKKKILDTHPDLLVKPLYTLIVDGTNLMRISFSDTKINSNGVHYGAVFQFLLQLREMLKKQVYDYVYVVFDGAKSGLNRYKYYPHYKENRDKAYNLMEPKDNLSEYGQAFEEKIRSMQKYLFNKNKPKREKSDVEKFVDENFDRERDLLLKYFNELYIRWIFDDDYECEGDDFISYYVQHKKPEERIVIMSTDEDITQLISDTVCVYNKKMDVYLSTKNYQKHKNISLENVVLKKVFCGDVSDNIKNISGLSEARLLELVPEIKERKVTINEVKQKAQDAINERISQKKKPLKWQENIVNGVCNGDYNGDFYEINRKIVDLSNPLMRKEEEEEIKSMMYNVQDPEGRSFENLYKMMKEDGIDELISDKKFSAFFEPYKPFIAIHRYINLSVSYSFDLAIKTASREASNLFVLLLVTERILCKEFFPQFTAGIVRRSLFPHKQKRTFFHSF